MLKTEVALASLLCRLPPQSVSGDQDLLFSTRYGIVNRLVEKVSKPRPRSESVIYCVGVSVGMLKVNPMKYRGLDSMLVRGLLQEHATNRRETTRTRDPNL